VYVDPKYDSSQMYEIRKGLLYNLNDNCKNMFNIVCK